MKSEVVAMAWNGLVFILMGLGLAACGSAPRGVVGSTDGDETAGSSTAASTSGSSTLSTTTGVDMSTSASTSSGEAPQPPLNDVLGIPDMPISAEEGCQAIDFLFVIDDSGSMYDEQVNLIQNFPTFSDTIQATLQEVTSYQVGVVATDAYPYNDPPCSQLGDLVISTQGGFDSSNMICGPYAAGHNFMTEEDDLAASFACAAQLGTYGDGYERPMDALLATLSDANDGPGECNEGFIRDEALLVIVIITDEWDGPGDPEGSASAGDASTWYEAVVEAKGGIEQNAVALALINYTADADDDPSACEPFDTYSDGVHIKEFTELFEENGFVGGICEADYGPIFQAAIGVIDTACENFIPPG